MIAALVRHLIESTVFAALVTLFPILMKKRGAAARHTIWLLAASKFALPVALFSAAGIQLRSFFPAHEVFLASSTVLPRVLVPAAPAPISSGTVGWIDGLILAAWFGGSTLMLALWLRSFLAPIGHSAPSPDSETEVLARMRKQIGLRRKVALRSIESNAEPAVRGVWRLTITLPKGLSTLLALREFESVLLHELAHASRRDNLTMSFVHTLVCLFWFHPLLWWIERRLIAEQELACDEFVLRNGPTSEEYAAGLLKVCRFHLLESGASTCGFAGSNLKNRLEAIMSFKLNHLNQHAPRLLLGTLLSAVTVVPLGMGLLATPVAYAQDTNAHKPLSGTAISGRAITCTSESKDYPMGTVIQVKTRNGGFLAQQMCVEDPNGHPLWVRTNTEARQRSQHVIIVPSPPPVFCKPASSPSPKYCACEMDSGPSTFGFGAIVYTVDGKGHLRCDKGKWRPATPEELGLREKN
ncbi:MAG TPA: M56 family metallopeptidase [Terriglobia bacterium]|nr:M56 family metallopeptidase [Terriglobia bacterium]